MPHSSIQIPVTHLSTLLGEKKRISSSGVGAFYQALGVDARASVKMFVEYAGEEAVPCPLGVD